MIYKQKLIFSGGFIMKTSNFKLVAQTLVCVAVLAALAGCNNTEVEPTAPVHGPVQIDEKFTASKAFAMEATIQGQSVFQLDGVNGDVRITGRSGGSTIEITGYKKVHANSMALAQQHLADLEVDMSELQNEVFIRTKQPAETNGCNYEVDYNISLPEHMEIVVDNINGAIVVTDIEANVVADLVNGSISAAVILPDSGKLECSLTNGKIEASIPKNTSGKLNATVRNGTISYTNLDLNSIDRSKTSLSGVCGTGAGLVSLSTVNGDINVNGF
jgi:hypothetical protein